MKAFQCNDNEDTDNYNRIILLSVENAASGAILHRATHVILAVRYMVHHQNHMLQKDRLLGEL